MIFGSFFKKKNHQNDKKQSFWEWFSKNNKKFLFLEDISQRKKEKFLNDFLKALHLHNENLYFQIGGHPNAEKVELIITAEGDKEYFNAAESLVNEAPEYSNWEIIALKPPMGINFKTHYDEYIFDPKKIKFIALNNNEYPKVVGLKVLYSNYTENQKEMFGFVSFLMLDAILGEKSSALDIDYLEVGPLPKNLDELKEFDVRFLSQIREYVHEKKYPS